MLNPRYQAYSHTTKVILVCTLNKDQPVPQHWFLTSNIFLLGLSNNCRVLTTQAGDILYNLCRQCSTKPTHPWMCTLGAQLQCLNSAILMSGSQKWQCLLPMFTSKEMTTAALLYTGFHLLSIHSLPVSSRGFLNTAVQWFVFLLCAYSKMQNSATCYSFQCKLSWIYEQQIASAFVLPNGSAL